MEPTVPSNVTDQNAAEQARVLTRRTFLTRVMALTGCSAVGVLLDACGAVPATGVATSTVSDAAIADVTSAVTTDATAASGGAATVTPETTATTGGPGGAPPDGGAGGPGGGGPGGGTETLDTFVGVTTDGTVVADLYPLASTGVSTDAVRTAATAFLAALTDDQRAATLFAVDDDEWRKWSNVDGYTRQGTSLKDMTDAQRAAAMTMLKAALSTTGSDTVQKIMQLNTTEGELLSQTDRFNEYLYWFTVMGTPDATEPWGFQLDGHHLIINYFVLGNQVVMAPTFMGAEPPVAPSGTYAGVSVLQTEQDQGLALIKALTDDQRSVAIIDSNKSGDNLKAGANGDNTVLAYAGIKGDALTSAQQAQLLTLIGVWVGNMADDHAKVKMTEVQAHIADTYFAWVGAVTDDAVFYYRVQSPVILIEFDHELPGPLGQNSTYASSVPTRRHIHTIVRTPNGNDYGKDLLRQHYLTHPHSTTTPASPTATPTASGATGLTLGSVVGVAAATLLPLRYRTGVPVSSAPMSAAPLVYDATGQVAWEQIWGGDDPDQPFCDLALAGGPPHRATLLEPVDVAAVRADPAGYAHVLAELARGLRMVTGLEVRTNVAPGWIGLVCADDAMAQWLLQAIVVENVAVRREDRVLFVPAGPDFRLDYEIKNVVTVVAKTCHYWMEHTLAA